MPDIDIENIEDFDLMEWVLSEKPVPAEEIGFKMDELTRKSRAHFVALVDRCWKRVK